ncbi:hypothetical protein MAQA_00855 [Listeria aquatica FSL S10-1188]|uniref:Uncharacterized protein n=1 Tax=Listeria aquatica FSL S10-1188 TaxID=1265818 RepID=W7B3M8_9LIST|nr:hypothetical protein MAQA_00855 [Listeria aquatica FSL S10-1188]
MVSACLAGIPCRYDGNHKENRVLKEMVIKGEALALCPEVIGGLTTPRNPAEIVGGDGFDVWNGTAKVMDDHGQDVTEAYKAGAKRAFARLETLGITTVILKEKSLHAGLAKFTTVRSAEKQKLGWALRRHI